MVDALGESAVVYDSIIVEFETAPTVADAEAIWWDMVTIGGKDDRLVQISNEAQARFDELDDSEPVSADEERSEALEASGCDGEVLGMLLYLALH
jgi:hypothetical protein